MVIQRHSKVVLSSCHGSSNVIICTVKISGNPLYLPAQFPSMIGNLQIHCVLLENLHIGFMTSLICQRTAPSCACCLRRSSWDIITDIIHVHYCVVRIYHRSIYHAGYGIHVSFIMDRTFIIFCTSNFNISILIHMSMYLKTWNPHACRFH